MAQTFGSAKRSALPPAIGLQKAGCEREYARVRVWSKPNLACQIENQFPMFYRSVAQTQTRAYLRSQPAFCRPIAPGRALLLVEPMV